MHKRCNISIIFPSTWQPHSTVSKKYDLTEVLEPVHNLLGDILDSDNISDLLGHVVESVARDDAVRSVWNGPVQCHACVGNPDVTDVERTAGNCKICELVKYFKEIFLQLKGSR